jgi:hypothetical protein
MSEPSIAEAFSVIAAVLATLAAIFSGFCAYLSYKLSCKLRDEMKSDERLIVSKIIHPGFVNKVQAFDHNNNPMNITWSNHINKLGNPENPCELIGIVDTEELFVRRNMGEDVDFCRLEIFHSFSSLPTVAIFDPVADFMG